MLPKVICGIRSPILEALRGALTIHNLSHPLWVSTCTSRGGSAVGTGDGRMGGVCVHTRVCVGWGCRGHSLISSAHPCRSPWSPHYCPPFMAVGVGSWKPGNPNYPPPVTFSGIPTTYLIYPKVTLSICRGRTHGQAQTHHLPLCKLCLAHLQGVLVTCTHHSVYSKDGIFRIKDRTAC